MVTRSLALATRPPSLHRWLKETVVAPKEASMNVWPDEFVSARNASRGLGKLIERLDAGEIEKAVIVNQNEPRAVLLTVLQYEILLNGKRDAK
jgi:hypothetical protein